MNNNSYPDNSSNSGGYYDPAQTGGADLRSSAPNFIPAPAPTPAPVPTQAQQAQQTQPAYEQLIAAGGYPPYSASGIQRGGQNIPQNAPSAQSSAPNPPQYGHMPPPPHHHRCREKQSLSPAVRVGLWIVGAAVAATVLFGCVLFWIFGINYLRGNITAGTQNPNSQSGDQMPSNDDDFYFSAPDNGNGQGGTGDNNSAIPTHSAGLGITGVEVELEFEIEGGYTSGVVISEFSTPSAFDGTQVQKNDMIVALDGTATPSIAALKTVLAKKNVGDKIKATVARYENGVAKTFDVTVTLIPFTSN